MGGEIDIEELASIHRVDAFDLTPDGTPVYTAHRDGSFELFVGDERITATPRDFRQPTWLEGRDAVLVLADEGGSEMYDLVEADPRSGETTTVLDDEHKSDIPVQSPGASDVVGFLSTREGSLDLYEIHLDSGDVEQLAAPDRPIQMYDWSPAGERVVYQEGLFEETRLCVTDGEESRVLLDFEGSEEKLGKMPYTTGTNFWSESGILFSSNQDDTANLGIVQPSGEYEWLVTNDRDTSPGGWAPDGERFAYFEARPGDNLVKVHEGDGSRVVLDSGFGLRVRWHPDGTPVALRLNYDSWGEIWHGDTPVVTEGRTESSLVEPSVVHFDSFDGRSIPGLVHEADGDRALVFAHGGPEHRFMNTLWYLHQSLVDRGYTVLSPDVRGSTGYGRAYRKLSDGDLGGGDVRDLAAGAEYLREQGYDQVGVFGVSYGGYLTLMALVETDAFEAGIDIAGIANLHTMMERTQGYLQTMLTRKLCGTPAGRPELYDERSPVLRADEIGDPLMIVQGANDPRVPQEEAEQIAAELEERDVPHEYLLFEDEGHGVEDSENRVEMLEQMEGFLAGYL